MKRKIYAMIFGTICLGLAMLYACKRNEGMQAEKLAAGKSQLANALKTEPNEVGVSNGWLKFQSLEAFNKVMNTLHNGYDDATALADWEKSYNKLGFTSLRKLYEEIDADTSENRTAPTVDSLINSNKLLDCPDSWFATTLNKDGYIQIADTLYSFRPGTKDGEAYAIPARNVNKVLAGVGPTGIDGVKIHHTTFTIIPFPRWQETKFDERQIPKPICSYPSGPMFNWWGQKGGDIYSSNSGDPFPEQNGRQVKLNYHRWRVGYIFYASAGIRLKMWKNTRFAGWQSVTYADQMIMEACIKGKILVPGLPPNSFDIQTYPVWPGFTKYAENAFEKTLVWTANGMFNEVFLDHFNFHFLVNYRNRIVERYISE